MRLRPGCRRETYLAGIDFVGEKIVAVNTFSTRGLRDAERFGGADFCAEIIAAAVRRAGAIEGEIGFVP